MQLERYNVVLYWIPLAGAIALLLAYLLLLLIPKLAEEKRRKVLVWILCSVYFLAMIPVVRISNLIEARSKTCFQNLDVIHWAKENWALENCETNNVVPSELDLFTEYNFIEKYLHCPLGGKYSINPNNQPPTCTIPEHNRMFRPF